MTQKVRLERTGKCDVEFEGEKLAETSSNSNGQKRRWTELKVFQTKGGRYVVQTLGLTKEHGEVTRSRVESIEDLDSLPDILGFGHLAKEIYKKLHLMFVDRL